MSQWEKQGEYYWEELVDRKLVEVSATGAEISWRLSKVIPGEWVHHPSYEASNGVETDAFWIHPDTGIGVYFSFIRPRNYPRHYAWEAGYGEWNEGNGIYGETPEQAARSALAALSALIARARKS